MLAAIDASVQVAPTLLGQRPISALTAVLWAGLLLSSPAPMPCSILSSISIAGAFAAAPHLGPRELEGGAMLIFVAVLVTTYTFRGKRFSNLASGVGTAAAYFGLAAAFRIVPSHFAGAWSDSRQRG